MFHLVNERFNLLYRVIDMYIAEIFQTKLLFNYLLLYTYYV